MIIGRSEFQWDQNWLSADYSWFSHGRSQIRLLYLNPWKLPYPCFLSVRESCVAIRCHTHLPYHVHTLNSVDVTTLQQIYDIIANSVYVCMVSLVNVVNRYLFDSQQMPQWFSNAWRYKTIHWVSDLVDIIKAIHSLLYPNLSHILMMLRFVSWAMSHFVSPPPTLVPMRRLLPTAWRRYSWPGRAFRLQQMEGRGNWGPQVNCRNS